MEDFKTKVLTSGSGRFEPNGTISQPPAALYVKKVIYIVKVQSSSVDM